jgi:hypothetical protein
MNFAPAANSAATVFVCPYFEADEFTLPLCAIHYPQNHGTGDKWLWWQEHKIDPLAVATRLWRESQHLPAPDNESPDASDPGRKVRIDFLRQARVKHALGPHLRSLLGYVNALILPSG